MASRAKAKKIFIKDIKEQIKYYRKMLKDIKQVDYRELSDREYEVKKIQIKLKESLNKLIKTSNCTLSDYDIDVGELEANKIFFNLMMLRYAIMLPKEEVYV